ncbi:toll-like receptor 3 [Juglans microcarpa x Juglans regia]|uniref:toll-like receptor 3 n=1 Tax=Juglans microcarpa x Juglans regia TaxID=2249226 RepID=UPI001B7DEAA2|nr:toll-like receptor 3 [Juglans microcarpa x Juglans regia]XP_040989239.1 toll-like receptor 3 [Juglans microcarpa x Juglans regia]
MESELVGLCIEAACQSRESVEKWRRQRRSLERLPSQLADALLRRLLIRRLLYPSLLEVFKHSAEEIDLRGENSVDAEWMAYLGGFRNLRSLNVSDCHRVTSSALWAMTGMTSLKELDLSRCLKVTDAGIQHLISISSLEKLYASETGVTTNGIVLLSSLKNLSVLDLGGLPITDQALSSLKALTKLQYLDLWGSKVSNKGAAVFQKFSKLSFLNIAWTNVTKFPNLSSLECLNMSNCTINSILEGDGGKAPLSKLIFSGATFIGEAEAFIYVETSFLSFLDLSKSSLQKFCFLPSMKALKHLDLSFVMIGDDLVKHIACIGADLKNLNLSNTRLTSAGVEILVGHVPNLEVLSLSSTLIDDIAVLYISNMPLMKVVDLSNTNVKGFIHQAGAEPGSVPSLQALESLSHLEMLNLELTHVRDDALKPLSSFQELRNLSLRSTSLTDLSLHYLSSLPKLTNLSIRDSVLTNFGLASFIPSWTLKMLDLRGCWLLTEDAILSFSKNHPQIEVRHELVHILPADNIGSSRPSPSRSTSRTLLVNKKLGNIHISPCFVDQRLKYSKQELLELQYSSIHASPLDRGINTSQMELN